MSDGDESDRSAYVSEAEEDDDLESASHGEEPEGENLNSDDEYDEEEEEDEHIRRCQERHGGFILDEAEVAGEVEFKDDWEDGADVGIINNDLDEHGPTARDIERRRRGTNLWDNQGDDEIEEYLRKRYGNESTSLRHFGDGGEDMSGEITQQSLLPDLKDPNIWFVRCQRGKEKDRVLDLMGEFLKPRKDGQPQLQIKSAFVPEGVTGYVYIEATKKVHVEEAIAGIRALDRGMHEQQMVPIKEMTDLLRFAKKSHTGNLITVMPKHEDLKTPLEYQAPELKKYFKRGDHARVIAGRYEGDTGLIIRAEENRVVLFSDLTRHELEVLPRDLQLCTDMATGVHSLGQFKYGDLVQLDRQTAGVIVRLEQEIVYVLNMNGKVVEVKPQAIHKKKDDRNTITLDSDQRTIHRKDIVKVTEGPHSGRVGEVKHLCRSLAFLYSKMYLDNGGIFVCKTRHLQLAGGNREFLRKSYWRSHLQSCDILESSKCDPYTRDPPHTISSPVKLGEKLTFGPTK